MTSVISFPKLEQDTVFQKSWKTYQVVLKENYNQHKTLYANVPKYLNQRFQVGIFY